jgi:dihydrofolate synthase/folylpolyglutamate synthase
MTYDEAVAFWFGRINYEVRSATPQDLKLERMRALLRLLGNPHDRLRIVHITGTKGKGSTAAMIAAILRSAGYRVGLFTSPHLVRVEERIVVDGSPIAPAELATRMAEVAAAVRELDAGPGPPPTFFEISTALGYLHFACRRVDVAVVEVGLGGRFDSTNVCRPLAAVVTSIGLDHTAQLGTTLEAIAYQKAGIIKPRVPVVSGVAHPGARAVIERVAAEQDAPVWAVGREFWYGYTPGTIAVRSRARIGTPQTGEIEYELGLLGEHQAANAAVAVAVVQVLRGLGLSVPEGAVGRGLRDVRWPARVEVVSMQPLVVLDSAHNEPSIEALVRTLTASIEAPGRKSVIFAVSSDKPYPEMLSVLAGYFDHFLLTRYGNNPRCVAPERLLEMLTAVAPSRSAAVYPTSAEAWLAVRATAAGDDLICITGSVFLAGELSGAVRE